jgi:hypothetical protein
MTLVMAEIVSFDNRADGSSGKSRVSRIAPVKRSRGLTRRSLLQRGTLVGGAVGLSVLGVLPPARRAGAINCGASGAEHRDIDDRGCGKVGDYEGYCQPGCGPSPVCLGDCCTSDNWHKNEGIYRNRYNECPTGTSWDGWLWYVLGCDCTGGCNRQYFKCHDGCTDTGSGWARSICKWVSTCYC